MADLGSAMPTAGGLYWWSTYIPFLSPFPSLSTPSRRRTYRKEWELIAYVSAHYFASPSTRNALSFLVGYSNTLGLVGGLCSIDYGFALMFLSVIVIARDGEWHPSNGVIYVVFMCCVLVHGVLASTISKAMAKLQTAFVV